MITNGAMENTAACNRWQQAVEQAEYVGAFVDWDSLAPPRPAPVRSIALER